MYAYCISYSRGIQQGHGSMKIQILELTIIFLLTFLITQKFLSYYFDYILYFTILNHSIILFKRNHTWNVLKFKFHCMQNRMKKNERKRNEILTLKKEKREKCFLSIKEPTFPHSLTPLYYTHMLTKPFLIKTDKRHSWIHTYIRSSYKIFWNCFKRKYIPIF